MFKGKPVKVVITGEAQKEYKALNAVVGREKVKGLKTSDYQKLLKSINQKIDLLKDNPQYGIHIPKNKTPPIYIKKYDVNNLWKVNLVGAWRMIYTIKGSEVDIIALILDLMNHKDYNKKFGYKKK